MSVLDETWDRPICEFCNKEIPYGEKSFHANMNPTKHLDSESKRTARLKEFCDATAINFYAANEEICKVVNDSAYDEQYLSTEEVQRRFIFLKQYNVCMSLRDRYFWELAEWILNYDRTTNI